MDEKHKGLTKRVCEVLYEVAREEPEYIRFHARFRRQDDEINREWVVIHGKSSGMISSRYVRSAELDEMCEVEFVLFVRALGKEIYRNLFSSMERRDTELDHYIDAEHELQRRTYEHPENRDPLGSNRKYV